MTPLLTAEAVAELLGLSLDQVYLLKHEIGFVRIKRSIRFDPETVRAYIDGHREGGAAAIRAINVRRL